MRTVFCVTVRMENVPFWVPTDGFQVFDGTEEEFYEGLFAEGVFVHLSKRRVDGETVKH